MNLNLTFTIPKLLKHKIKGKDHNSEKKLLLCLTVVILSFDFILQTLRDGKR